MDEEESLNPLAFLGLKRVGVEGDMSPKKPVTANIELNRRGIPARKRKKNSLIFGGDDLVSIPVKSPVKKKSPLKSPKKDVEKEKPVEEKKPVVVHISSNEVKRLARLELDSLARNGDDSEGVSDEGGEYSDSITDEEENSYLDIEDEENWKPGRKSPENLLPDSRQNYEVEGKEGEDNLSVFNRHNAQRLGVALRNLLKLPKAHRWVCFEFFYSNIDKALFQGENDFLVCLKESFPQLKTRRLTRVEWCKVRRLMGKPRRCSEAFFAEERLELEKKRGRIRSLQQRKAIDPACMKDLPDHIPMQLTLGTRVTARLRVPQDGLFTGSVDAVDPSNNTYRISFQRQGLGTHSIPDYEVLSVEPPELVPLSSYCNKPKLKIHANTSSYPSPTAARYGTVHSPLANDPLLSGSTPRTKSIRLDQILGGYPVSFLFYFVKLNKCLKAKQEKVNILKQLNGDVEKGKSFGTNFSEEFLKKYASTVLDIDKTNKDLNSYLREVSQYTTQIGNQEGPTLSLPDQIRENCQEDGYDMVNRYNVSESPLGQKVHPRPGGGGQTVHSPRLLALITQLSALMLQVKRVADGERNAAEMQALQDSLDKIKSGLQPENSATFQDHVEVHMHHIQQGLSQVGNLTAFMQTNPSSQNTG
jgi:hypothetical protein